MYRHNPSKYLIDYLEAQGTVLPQGFIKQEYEETKEEEPTVQQVPVNNYNGTIVQQVPASNPNGNAILFE